MHLFCIAHVNYISKSKFKITVYRVVSVYLSFICVHASIGCLFHGFAFKEIFLPIS